MRKKISKLLILLLPFALGIIIGASSMVFWSVKSLQFIKSSTDLNFLAYEIDEATDKYLYSPNIDAGIFALQHLIEFEENFYIKGIDAKEVSKNYLHDLAVAYVRLGNLYEKKGDNEKALEYFKKGLEIVSKHQLYEKWKGTEKEIKTIDDIKKFIAELDNRLIRK